MKPLLLVLALLGLVAAGLAQAPAPTGTAPAKPTGTAPADTKPTPTEQGGTIAPSGDFKDPTKASPALREAMTPARPTPAPGAPPRLPTVFLRGRVLAKDRPPTAIVEVDGKLYVVVVGSLVAGPGNTVLRITDLTSNDVKIAVEPLKETIILR
jgi:hypothetical protein